MYNEAKGAKCEDCGGTVGLGADGKPYRQCFSCRNQKNKLNPSIAAQNSNITNQMLDSRQIVIIRESALKSAVDYARDKNGYNETMVLDLAKKFEKWILGEKV